LIDLAGTLGRLHEIGDPEFHRFEYQLVSRYRLDEDAQEEIAVALTALNLSTEDPVVRSRLDEIFGMLQHVHDPLIRTAHRSN